ncbi:hypothetical protein TWF106_008915 [Orbilia oligospora]|uniref:Uncharacterized protein n=1 Tax=Orbilia oligospora TaxID=2813651 RepID=A0A7C8ULA5_ORBOL|nr:hypothetical protein TWF106_008915 [Orbilia oligospora]
MPRRSWPAIRVLAIGTAPPRNTGPVPSGDIYSLAIGNKGGGGVKACDKCTATLANIAQLPGLKIPDMAVPEFRWKYEGVVELADGSGHLGFEEDTDSRRILTFGEFISHHSEVPTSVGS